MLRPFGHTMALLQRAMALVQFSIVQASFASFRAVSEKTFRWQTLVSHKVLKDHAHVFCQKFYGWRMQSDLETFAALPDGSLTVDVLAGTCVHELARCDRHLYRWRDFRLVQTSTPRTRNPTDGHQVGHAFLLTWYGFPHPKRNAESHLTGVAGASSRLMLANTARKLRNLTHGYRPRSSPCLPTWFSMPLTFFDLLVPDWKHLFYFSSFLVACVFDSWAAAGVEVLNHVHKVSGPRGISSS